MDLAIVVIVKIHFTHLMFTARGQLSLYMKSPYGHRESFFTATNGFVNGVQSVLKFACKYSI